MGIFVSKVPTEWTVYDEARALIADSKKRYKELCAEDTFITDDAADSIAHLVVKALESYNGKKRLFIRRPDDMDELVWCAALESRVPRILKTVHTTFPKYDINFTNTDKDTVYLYVIDTERVANVVEYIRKEILNNARLGKSSSVITRPDHIPIDEWTTCMDTELDAVQKAFEKFLVKTNNVCFNEAERIVFIN